MYPKKDYFLIRFRRNDPQYRRTAGRKNNKPTNNVAILLSFYCILNISSRILLATDGPNEDESCNTIFIEK